MKALTIHQPWAWAIAEGHKDIENRTWRTSYRGPLLIHAGKTFDAAGHYWIQREIGIALPAPSAFQQVSLVAIARLTGCVTESDSPWFSGPYGWVIEDVARIKAVYCRGMPGLFEVPDQEISPS